MAVYADQRRERHGARRYDDYGLGGATVAVTSSNLPEVTADGLSLDSWISAALASSATEAVYADADPEKFKGWWTETPGCQGAWGFGETPDQSRRMLAEALEDWVLMETDAGRAVPAYCGLRVEAAR